MKSTYSVGDLIEAPTTVQLSTEFNGVKSTEQLSVIDRALQETADLINSEWKPWYAKQAYRLGADRYLGIASDARRGRQPAKLFSYLLRRTT